MQQLKNRCFHVLQPTFLFPPGTPLGQSCYMLYGWKENSMLPNCLKFHGAQISQGFLQGRSKSNRKFPFESNLELNRRIVVYSFNVKFLLTAIWDRSQMFRFFKNIARSLLGKQTKKTYSKTNTSPFALQANGG